ncbi:O-methyltransferase [Pseudoscourfieldia marina]
MRAPPAQHTSQQVVQVARKRTHHKQQQHTRVLFPFPAAACRTSCRRRHVVTKSSTLSGASSSRVPKPLLPLNTHLYEYILEHTREHQTLRDLRAATCDYPHGAQMQVPPEQGVFLQMLVEITNARKVVEIGVFTGYSSLAMAMAMNNDKHARLLGLESDERPLVLAEQYWEKAGVRSRIDVVLGDAVETLRALAQQDGQDVTAWKDESGEFDASWWAQPGTVDIAFVDANKRAYDEYVQLVYPLLRTGGVVVLDNVLWKGKVADPEHADKTTESIRQLNATLFHDERWTYSLLPIGDGVALCRKR